MPASCKAARGLAGGRYPVDTRKRHLFNPQNGAHLTL
jgi:hypothetical protein